MPNDSPGRIPALDGLRAIAIAFVFVGHAIGTRNLPSSERLEVFGELGVLTFFVVSGFLITTLLVREHEHTGRISLKHFYIRRTWRIFPAFYTYLAVMVVVVALGWLAINGTDFLFGATYLMDFHAQDAWAVGHLWSLAVEEQFYVVWPCTLVFLGIRRGLYFALAAVALGPVFRLVAYFLIPDVRHLTDRAFPFVFDALAIGCLLALLRDRLEGLRWYVWLLDSPAFWFVPVIAFLAQAHGPAIDVGVKPTIIAVAAAISVHRLCLRHPTKLASRVLELRGFVWVGTLSYSLYLWQQPFLNAYGERPWYTAFPLNIGLAIVAASASYYLVERPLLKWRARRAPHTHAHPLEVPAGSQLEGRLHDRIPVPLDPGGPASRADL